VSRPFDVPLVALKMALSNADIEFTEVWFQDGRYAGSQDNEGFAEWLHEEDVIPAEFTEVKPAVQP
jgi:hypothetical protein